MARISNPNKTLLNDCIANTLSLEIIFSKFLTKVKEPSLI
jgi:hypothetical protein